MKKLLATLIFVAGSQLAFSQKTPPRPPHPPHPHHAKGEHPPRPLSPKEVWQKMKQGKKQADAKRDQDIKEMREADRKSR